MDAPNPDGSVRGIEPEKKIFLDRNLQIIFGVTLIAVMGVASIAPAFPRMMADLAISSAGIGLLITVFTLPGVILAPVLGILADRFGRKKVLVPALILFGLAGGACALSRSFHLLLVLRFIQGVGAASLGALNATIIGDLFQGKQRTQAMGYNASVLSVGTAGYPAIGGALATFGWYFPFLLPLLALPLGLVVIYRLDSPAPRQQQQLRAQFRATLKSMANSQVIGLFIAGVVTFVILYGPCLTYVPLMLDQRFAAPPVVIGFIFTCMSLTTALISSQIGKLVHRYSEKNLMKAVFVLYALAMALMPFVHHLWFFVLPIVLFGIGHGINLPCLQSLLAGLAPMAQRATFMSINGMVLRLGQTIGPLAAGLIFALWGVETTFFFGACLALGMSMLAMVMLR